jgi:16S rRNA (cytidine1402-2'-O)-methyltransferase
LLSVLILAATPIGNLSDASKRLEKTLIEASFIAAEDTRELKRLCRGLGITLNAKLFSLHEHNERDRIVELVELAKDETVVLVSDAGMPTISDPGFLLVRACADAGVEIQIVPGPSAVVSALAVSGLPTDRFSFEGFLPRKSGERVRVFESLITEKRTMVFFEAPHRILESLKDARKVFGADRLASVSRELTKKFEETKRGSLQDLVDWAEKIPKGEMVLVVSGAGDEQLDYEELGRKALLLAESGMGLKQASTELADKFGASKTAIYQHALQAKA